MKIGVDVDGVLADFNESFIRCVIKVLGEDKFPPRPFDIPTWNYPQHYGYTNEQTSKVWEHIKASSTFWYHLNPYPWTEDVLRRLLPLQNAGHDIYFITARPGLFAKGQTEDWLLDYGFDHATVLITAKKGFAARTLDLDTYIDDKPANCEEVARVINTQRYVEGNEYPKPDSIYMLNQPWNASSTFEGYVRCHCKRIGTPLQMLDEICGKP
jgi:5'(3')-deoxyribonucleotidase